MEKILTISYVAPENGDAACLMVLFVDGKMTVARNAFYGIEAQLLYNRLTGTELGIKSNMRKQPNEHWLVDAFIRDQSRAMIPGAQPFLLSVEQLEDILKEPVRRGPGALLHNKDCPYGYRCRAMDCIECAEIYAAEEVDGLASGESDKVNTADGVGMKLEET